MLTVFRLELDPRRLVLIGQYATCQEVLDVVSDEWRDSGYAKPSLMAVRAGGQTKEAVLWMADHSALHPFGLPCWASDLRSRLRGGDLTVADFLTAAQ